MKVIVASKNKEQVFNDLNVINIGTTPNCNYNMILPFEIVVSVQKQENGKWQIIDTSKSGRLFFKGQPVNGSMEISSVCKLIINGSDDFISIKINPDEQIQNKKSAKTDELNEQDIEILYGKGAEVQTRLKLGRRKEDLEKRRVTVSKEVSYKSNSLRAKISQNEIILSVLNIFIFIVPMTIAYILNDTIKIESHHGELQTRILFLVAVAFIILTALLKQSQFLTLQIGDRKKTMAANSTILIRNMCSLISVGTFFVIISASIFELFTHKYQLMDSVAPMMLLCSFLCIFLGVFSGFTKNVIAESAEELDTYERREDFQDFLKDYQQWINLFVNNFTRRKLKDINNKIFSLQIMCAAEYILGIFTSPFLAYGVSQTLADQFTEAAGTIKLADGFSFSPIFLTLSTLMIIFAFHCFAVAFSITKRVHASDVIKQDGFSAYNVHGVTIHGVENTRNLKKESKKFFLIAVGVVFVEISMNVSYFINELGRDIQGMILSFLCALIPTVLLIMETNMVANTKFELKIREDLIEKVDKDY